MEAGLAVAQCLKADLLRPPHTTCNAKFLGDHMRAGHHAAIVDPKVGSNRPTSAEDADPLGLSLGVG